MLHLLLQVHHLSFFTYFDGTSSIITATLPTSYTLTAAPLGTHIRSLHLLMPIVGYHGSVVGQRHQCLLNAVPTFKYTGGDIARCRVWPGVSIYPAQPLALSMRTERSRAPIALIMTFSSQIPNFFSGPWHSYHSTRSLVQYFCQPWYCYLFHQCHNRWNLLWSCSGYDGDHQPTSLLLLFQ